MNHPAKFNPKLVPYIDLMLGGGKKKVLDPFAGTGWIFDALPGYDWTGVEIEPEWAALHHLTQVGNAIDLTFADCTFDAIITSPTFGNRMADHHLASDSSKRITYRHVLGRPLHDDNTGQFQWGDYYKVMHNLAWEEAYRVLKPGGIFILNIKDHIRSGAVIPVTDWHVANLLTWGFRVAQRATVPLFGNGYGQNGKSRVGYESLIKFVKGDNDE